MTIIVRFAPSPTGFLHLGNARPALFNWLFAQKHGGRFLLRYDDTDVARSTAEFAAAIGEDLGWLGIRPDFTMKQSDRFDRYEAVKADLVAKGVLYPCYETAEELEYGRRRRLGRGLPPVYDRAALKLSTEDRARLEAEGRRPHWRFLLPNFDRDPHQPVRTPVSWDDLVRGAEVVDLASLSDPVLIREDGSYLYTLPSVIDDIDTGITHVIRGEDHVTNTGVQIAIFRAIAGTEPVFAHLNLLTDTTGEGLSKRTGALSLRSLRERGLEPEAVAVVAVNIGTSHAIEPISSLDQLVMSFDLAHVSKSAARFDPGDLDHLNARTLHAMPFAIAAPRLKALGLPEDEAFWLTIRGNIGLFREASDWWRVITGPLATSPSPQDAPILAAALQHLPEEPFDGPAVKSWLAAITAATGAKGKALFLPLRLALTGLDHGPELAPLMRLIGRGEIMARLST